MKGLSKLYHYAEKGNIFVYFGHVGFSPGVTIKDFDEQFNIAIDPCLIHTEGEERQILLHELSHIATNTFYKNYDDLIAKKKAENKALRWQIEYTIPMPELLQAVKEGYTEIWELADFFEVPEGFIRQAMLYYHYGHIA